MVGLVDHLGEEAVGFSLFLLFQDRGITYLVDLLGEEAVGFPFPGKVRLGSVQVVGLVDHLGEEAVGFSLFSLFPDRGITYLVDLLGEEAVGFPFPGKVRLGSSGRARGSFIRLWGYIKLFA